MIEAMTDAEMKKLAKLSKEKFAALPPETLAAYWKGATTALASNVVFAIKNLKASGGGMMLNMATGKLRAWETDFMDSLDLIGYVVDRDKFFATKYGPKTPKKQKGSNR